MSLKPWKPGQSGNPAGRPKGSLDLQALARTHTKEALNTLIELMRHADKDSVRVMAADKVLDRAWGRAAQNINATLDDKRDATDWRTSELVAFLLERGSRRGRTVDESPGPRELN